MRVEVNGSSLGDDQRGFFYGTEGELDDELPMDVAVVAGGVEGQLARP